MSSGNATRQRIILYSTNVLELAVFLFVPTLFFWRGLNSLVIRAGFASWLLLRFSGATNRPLRSTSNGLALGLAMILAISSSFSGDPQTSFRGLLSILDGFLLFFMLQDAPRSRSFWKVLGWSVLSGVALVGLDVITQKYAGIGLISRNPLWIEEQSQAVIRGPFSTSTPLTMVSIYLSCIFLFLMKRDKSILRVASIVALLGLTGAAIFLSKSRNALLLASLLAVLFGWIAYRWKGLLTILLLGGALTAALPQARETVSRLIYFKSIDTPRLQIWQFAVEYSMQRPWLGIGMKMYPKIRAGNQSDYQKILEDSHLPDLALNPQHPHNVFLETLVEDGLLGLLFLVLLTGSCLRRAWLAAKRPEWRYPALFAGTGLALALLSGFFDFSLSARYYGYTLFFFCGLCAAVGSGTERDSSKPEPQPGS